MPEVLYPLR